MYPKTSPQGRNIPSLFLAEPVGKSFQVVDGSSTRSLAQWQEVCQSRGGRLASINSAEEQQLAADAVKMSKKRAVLTGMKRISPHKYFINGDGEKLPYS